MTARKIPVRCSTSLLLCVLGTAVAVVGLICYFQAPWFTFSTEPAVHVIEPQKYAVVTDYKKEAFNYSTDMPLIFIDGVSRSGSTLLRVMLDAHPEIRCAQDTRVIPKLLDVISTTWKDPGFKKELDEAGITPEVLDPAVAAFILEIIVRQGPPAPRLCSKDPHTLNHAAYLHSLFPNAKFILMNRDGRSVVHSIISRKLTIEGFDRSDYRKNLKQWNQEVQLLNDQCSKLGPTNCMTVMYELFVMHPRPTMEMILKFLDVPWNETVLHHEKLVDQSGGISLSLLEDATDQVIKPINVASLIKWVGHIPADVERDMADIAPMLKNLGYNPDDNHPYFGESDYSVVQNTKDIEENRSFWSAKERQISEKAETIRNGVQ